MGVVLSAVALYRMVRTPLLVPSAQTIAMNSIAALHGHCQEKQGWRTEELHLTWHVLLSILEVVSLTLFLSVL